LKTLLQSYLFSIYIQEFIMQKQLRAISILSGTAIGSGMISLPIVLAHIGIVPSIFLMIICAFMTYISALIRTELNLHSDSRFTLELVGLKFSGKGAAFIGNISLRLLQFSLMSAYIYGLSSVIGAGSCTLKLVVATGIFILLAFSSHKIICVNQKLFAALLFVIIASVICMVFRINLFTLPHNTNSILLPQFCVILPTLFTSFGFQGSLHSITKFCNNDPKLIGISCFFGSFLPAILYIAWITGVIALIASTQPALFQKMAMHGIDINELIQSLCSISNAHVIKSAVFTISTLAIITSIIGVGLALVDDLDLAIESVWKRFACRVKNRRTPKLFVTECTMRKLSAFIAVAPSTIVAILVPNAFVKVLSFAGMILAIIAIFLPAFLLTKIKEPRQFKLLRQKTWIFLCVIFGVIIVLCEVINIIL
jgi:tyrosine-specific transport protein